MLGLLVLCIGTLGLPFSLPLRLRCDAIHSPQLLPALRRDLLTDHQQAEGDYRVCFSVRRAPPLSWLLRCPQICQCCSARRASGSCGPPCSLGELHVSAAPRVRMTNARLLACRAAEAASAASAVPSPSVPPPAISRTEYAYPQYPLGCTGVFEASRRWMNASRPLREAPTAEARLRVLMQQAVEGPPNNDPSKFREMPPLSEVHRATELRAVPSGALETAAATPAAAFVSRLSSGVTLFDMTRPVSGCAAMASVRVALHFPPKDQLKITASRMDHCTMSSSSSSRLCCAAGRQGAKVYVWGESDSLLVGGFLQLLSRSLSGGSPCGASFLAAAGPTRLLRRCRLLDLLPYTRIRGFRGAVELIWRSTCDLLGQCTSCEAALSLGKGLRHFDGAGKGSHVDAIASNHGCAGTESTKAATAIAATAVPMAPPAPTAPTAFLGAGGASTVCSQGPLGDMPDPLTLPVEGRGQHLRQHEGTAVLMERSHAALPLGGGVGSEAHVLVSGGVDSAVSLFLMREWGFRPKPVFLKVWAPEATQLKEQVYSQAHQGRLAVAAAAAAAAAACPWREDAEMAAAVAAAAGLPLEVVPMQQQYWDRVITTFLEGAR